MQLCDCVRTDFLMAFMAPFSKTSVQQCIAAILRSRTLSLPFPRTLTSSKICLQVNWTAVLGTLQLQKKMTKVMDDLDIKLLHYLRKPPKASFQALSIQFISIPSALPNLATTAQHESHGVYTSFSISFSPQTLTLGFMPNI